MPALREATRLKEVRTAFARAAEDFGERGVVAQRAADELLDRLQVIRRQPDVILDIGAGTGRMTRALSQSYPQADIIALDASPHMLHQWPSTGSAVSRLNNGGSLWTRLFSAGSRTRAVANGSAPRRVLGDATRLPLADSSVDFVVSNLALTCCDPEQFMIEVARVLTPGGVVMFTTLGPDTLKELSQAWGQVGGIARVTPFVDMHDLGDIMVRAGLADPVVDMEMLTLTHRHVPDLWADYAGSPFSASKNARLTVQLVLQDRAENPYNSPGRPKALARAIRRVTGAR